MPAPLKEQLRSFFAGFGQSAVIENAGNKCSDIGRESKNERVSRTKRFYQPHISKLLEVYERSEVQVDTRLRIGRGRIEPGAFKVLGDPTPSIPDETLRKVMGRASWATTTALGLNVVPGTLQLAQHLVSMGDWESLGMAWLSMFCLSGFVIQQGGSQEYFLVVDSTEYAVLLWPLHRVSAQGRTLLAPRTDRQAEYSFRHIFDVAAHRWKVWPHKVSSPLQLLADGLELDEVGIFLLLEASSLSIIQAAAQGGFRGIGQVYLEKLSKHYEWEWNTEHLCFLGRVERLIRLLMPAASQEQLLQWMQKREPKLVKSFLHSDAVVQQAGLSFRVWVFGGEGRHVFVIELTLHIAGNMRRSRCG